VVVCVCVCAIVYVCVCMCVCVRVLGGGGVCVCVCVSNHLYYAYWWQTAVSREYINIIHTYVYIYMARSCGVLHNPHRENRDKYIYIDIKHVTLTERIGINIYIYIYI
jgi:hypothetical protein